LASEPEPGTVMIADDAICGIHITRLTAGGIKAGTDADKITVARCPGSPIVLAPVNDLLGIAITEGIEDGLSVYEATGLGVWAAGSAPRLPTLAEAIPHYVECVNILVDSDPAGRRHATELAKLVEVRGMEVRLIELAALRSA